MVAVDPEPAAYPGGQHRLQPAALAPRQPLRVQPGAGLEGMQVAQKSAVVGVQCHGQGAAGPVADPLPAGLLQFGGELRIAPRGGEIEAEQGLLAVVQLGHGGQHSGRHPGGPATGRRIGHHGVQPPAGRPPGGDQPDDAASDDEHIGVPGCWSR